MAFGTWLKNIIGKIGSAVKKAIPIAKKVIGAVAPAVHQIGGMIGGPIGTGIQKIAGVAGKFVDKADMLVNGTNAIPVNGPLGPSHGVASLPQPRMLGANGAGIRQLTPRLK